MKKIIASILLGSFLMSNVAFATDQVVRDDQQLLEKIFADDQQVFGDDQPYPITGEEDGQDKIAVVPLIGLIVAVVALGCKAANDEGKALARRDRSALKTYSKHRWQIRTAVLGAAGAASLFVLRCFENGLMGT